MKSYLPILLVLSFLFTCCSKNSYELQVLHDNSNPLSDNRMSLDDAYNYISTNRGRCSTKGGSFTIDTMFNINGKNSCFLIRYNKGWELISADKRNPRVLMECSEGQINSSEDLFFNPTQRSFLKNQIKKVSLSLSSDVIGENEQYSYLNKPDIPYDDNCENREELRGPIGRIILNDTTVVTSCNHIVPTRWGQGYPWNVRAPYKDSLMTIHCSTGCTIVGVAQYLYFVMN